MSDPDDEAVLPADVRALLAEETTWAEPSEGFDDALLGRMAAARAEAPRARTAQPRQRPSATAIALSAVFGAAAAIAIVVGLAGFRSVPTRDTVEIALSSTPGSVQVEKTGSGWRIDLEAPELPRVDGDRYYAAYLDGPSGRVALGTFNEGSGVILWAGAPPKDNDRLVIVIEPDGTEVATARMR